MLAFDTKISLCAVISQLVLHSRIGALMPFLLLMTLIFFNMNEAFSDSNQYFSNSVSIGKVIINGQDIESSNDIIEGAGIQGTIKKTLEEFSIVDVNGVFEVIYRHGPPSLSISGDDNIIKHVLSEVSNNTLKLSIDKSYKSAHPIVIKVFSAKIQRMKIEGAGTVSLNNISTDQLTLNVLGSVDIIAKGKTTRFNLNLQGSGDVRARYLDADIVNIFLTSTSDIEVTAHTKLQVNITGVGDVLYFGSPKEIIKQISGLGDIEAGE